jgi:hypothetical protein
MNNSAIQMVSKEVYRRFPDFSGVKPKVQAQKPPTGAFTEKTYLLTFHQNARLGDEKVLPRWVRVVVDESGKILKISTSR